MSQHLFGLLHKHNLDPNQYCVLWHCAYKVACPRYIFNPPGVILYLQANKYLDADNGPTDKAKEALADFDKLFRKTKVIATTHTLGDGYMEKVRAYRAKFPADRKSSDDEVSGKIAKLFRKGPDITWDIIMQAADLYLGSITEERYCMKAGNFIENNVNNTHTVMEYIERVTQGEAGWKSNNVTGIMAA
jgi:hypothetical protein